MILNKQKKVRLATRPLQAFLRKTQKELNIAGSEITVAFVTDAEIARWNEQYRGKKGPTDVLSFPATTGVTLTPQKKRSAKRNALTGKNVAKAPPNSNSFSPLARPDPVWVARLPAVPGSPPLTCPPWRATRLPQPGQGDSPLFLGDIAIAPETAQRYAKKNGRTLARELRVLILHGILHLMGYDHESDTGQMNRIEQKLRRRLGSA